jgi:phenylacetic acid degradation operon negative regulatory protein
MQDGDLVIGIMASLSRGEYTTGELIGLTRPFAVTMSSLRTNLHRLRKKGVLEITKRNGKTAYAFSGKGRAITANVAAGFSTPDWSGWDGSYRGILFSLPSGKANARYRLTRKLALYRFAPLFPGFWIRPCRSGEQADAQLAALLADPHCRTLRFHPDVPITSAEADGLWDVSGAAAVMREALKLAEADLATERALTPEAAFVRKLATGERLVTALFRDPLLPRGFLPPDWPAQRLRRLFTRFDAVMTKRSRPFWEGVIGKDKKGKRRTR